MMVRGRRSLIRPPALRCATPPMTSALVLSGSITPAFGGNAEGAGDEAHPGAVSRRRKNLRMTTSWTCLSLGLSLGAGLWSPLPAAAQQIIQGGGDGGRVGGIDGAGGIAGGGGGRGNSASGAGGSAAQVPGGSASPGEAGETHGGIGGPGGAAGTPNDLAAGGGGGGGDGNSDSGISGDGGAGGAGGAGTVLGTTGPIQLGTDHAGGAGMAGSPGTAYTGGGGGGGGGGLVLAGAGAMLDTSGFNATGGAGGAGVAGGMSGGGGAGLVLLDGGTITVAAGAGGTSAITGGQGSDGSFAGNGGAGLFLYNGGTLSHQAGTITGGAGGSGQFTGHGGAGVLSNQGTIDNRATITGGRSGDAYVGYLPSTRRSGGAGVEAWGGTVANTATGVISGGAGGNQTSIYPLYAAGAGGAGVVFRDGQTASLSNAGTISGGTGGTVAVGSNFGPGGVGVVGAASGGISIINSGSISGGLSGDGVRANAVELFGSNNRFEIQAGSNIVGNVVVAGGGTNNVFALGGAGDSNSFNLLDLTSIYTGFTAFEKAGTSTWALAGAGSQNWMIREGTLSGNTSSMAGNLTFATGPGTRAVVFDQAGDGTYSGTISGDGGFTKTNTGILTLANVQNYTGGTIIQGGTLRMGAANALVSSAGVRIDNGSWDLNGYNQTVKRLEGESGTAVHLGAATLTIDNSVFFVFSGDISGSGGLTKTGSGGLNMVGNLTYSGPTNVAGGALRIGQNGSLRHSTAINVSNGAWFTVFAPNVLSPTVAVSLTGFGSQFDTLFDQQIGSLAGEADTIVVLGTGVVLTTGANNASTVFDGTIGSARTYYEGSLTKVGTGRFTLNGVNEYQGATLVNAGSLIVNGSIAASSSVTVASGATLGGSGVVPTTVIQAGGTLAPGNSIGTLTVRGDLTFMAGSTYQVEVSPSAADRVNVSGIATLNGATLSALYAPGAYVTKRYTVLNASGGVNGTFSGPVNTNLPANFSTALNYDATNAYLDLTLNYTPGPNPPGPTPPGYGNGLTVNQTNVANGLINSFNTAGGIPLVFGALTPAGLTQASGEAATGIQQTTINVMDRFVNLMTDPYAGGRTTAMLPMSYAPLPRGAQPLMVQPQQRWSVWAAGYGGTQSTRGNAFVGSNTHNAGIYGFAAGADVRVTPDTILGFALGGAGTSYHLVNGLGSGSSNVFQAGLYGRHTFGPAYVAGSLAYGWQDVTTDRRVQFDQLRARFNANAFSGRLETGYRFDTPFGGLTPYAAGQFIHVSLPAYREEAITGPGIFALSYASKSVTTWRTELGLRADKAIEVGDGTLVLRSRLAWAHNFNLDRSLSASFLNLPASGFVVNGAAQARNAALVSAGAEMKWRNGWSVSASFEGSFSNRGNGYAGKGSLRYQW